MSQQWLDRGACPSCGSSDGNVPHADGHSYCFSCKKYFKAGIAKVIPMVEKHSDVPYGSMIGTVSEITDRKISKETARKYNTQIKFKSRLL